MKTKGYFFAILSAVTYGLIPLFILPIKAMHFSLDVTLFYRFTISALFILAILLYRKENLKINRSEFFLFLLLGILFALSSEFLFLAYDYLSAGIASTILFVYPAIVALIMAFFFKEKITRMTALSLFITLAGIYLLSTKQSALDINFAGLAIALLSALCYALYIVKVNKSEIKASGYKITFYSLVFSASYYLAKALWFQQPLLLPNAKLLVDIALFGLLTSVISITALVYAIKQIGSTPTSIMGALEPVVAVAISVLFFHENFTFRLSMGISLILTGVVFNILADSKKFKKTENLK